MCVCVCVYLVFVILSFADGHHKLIRCGVVTHGGIDGYSRLVVFLKCSNNNKSETVYEFFLDLSGVKKCGLPSRVRSDHGKDVAIHMMESIETV